MTEITEIAFEGIFVDIDQKEIGLHNKIGFAPHRYYNFKAQFFLFIVHF